MEGIINLIEIDGVETVLINHEYAELIQDQMMGAIGYKRIDQNPVFVSEG